MDNEKKYLPERVESYEELKNVFEEFHIDSDQTRFYIGDDYTDPKALSSIRTTSAIMSYTR